MGQQREDRGSLWVWREVVWVRKELIATIEEDCYRLREKKDPLDQSRELI